MVRTDTRDDSRGGGEMTDARRVVTLQSQPTAGNYLRMLGYGTDGRDAEERTPTQLTADLTAFVGDTGTGGVKGLVPAPGVGDAGKYLDGGGSWLTLPTGGVTDHGALTGLGDDDHAIYLLAAGGRDLTGNQLVTNASELRFRSTAQRIYSSAANVLDIDTLVAGTINLGATSGTINLGNTGNVIMGNATLSEWRPNTTLKVTIGSTGKRILNLFVGGDIDMDSGGNFVFSSTTGTKIGTGITQMMAFFNATPIAQPSAITKPSGGTTVDTESRTAINAIIDALGATVGLGLTA